MESLSSRVVYRNAWMSVREDTIRRDDGSTGIYGVVDKQDFAIVVARQDEGLWLVAQYRYPVGRRAWELPQGGWPGDPAGTPEDLARAELAEETGLRAGRVEHLGHLYAAYGFCSQGCDVFLATDLVAGETAREHTEQDMEHRWFADAEVDAMVLDGGIVDAVTLAALHLWGLRRPSGRAAGTAPGTPSAPPAPPR